MSDRARPRVVHVATVDMSVRHLLLNQLLALRNAGFDVAAASASGPDIDVVRASGVVHYALPFTRRITPIKDLRAFAVLWRLFRRERFTIVHTHQIKAALFAQVAARLAGVPIVVNTIHGFYFQADTPKWRRKAWIALERAIANLSSLLLSQNREDVEMAIRARICPAAKIEHLGNGIDVRRFDPAALDPARVDSLREELGLLQSDPVVGFVGRLVEEKGLLELFDAVRRLREEVPRLRLLVIGPVDSQKRDALSHSTADRYGIRDITVFTGYRHDVPELYALMTVCVLPSHREGLPRALMEAAAMGIPCVASDVRGCRDVVIDGETGLLVPVRDAAALASAAAALLADERRRSAMSARARAVARERFDERMVFERVINAYDRLLRHHGAGLPVVKRIMDVCVGTLLLAVSLPTLAIVALVVRTALGSPVLFRQQRPGLGGRPFEILKFRTMRDARARDGAQLPDAERLTRVGRWLRKTSIDEIPELFNVLRGDMSLVGPRPLLPQYLDRYSSRQARRHEVRPGLTGLAQVSGRNALSWEDRFELDVWYVDHWSLLLDLRILARTIQKVLFREGISQPGHQTAAEFTGTNPPSSTPPVHGG